ncbi:MAG: porin family protein, partial [Betaproteobacteria bacterium]|nr:porin family protein [Betaproteobacteria bacterium]
CMSLGFAQTADAQGRGPIVNSWTGFYVGGNVGYSWGKADTTAAVSPFTQVAPPFLVFPGASSFIPLKPNGFIGGGQIGYNWEVAPRWLAGIETDLQWSGQKDSKLGTFTGSGACYLTVCSFTNTTDITAKLSWFGTVRGRLGVVSNNMLFYGTGGLAYGKVSVSGTNTLSVAGAPPVIYSTPFSYSRTKAGWALGAGIEGRIGASNWSWKAEYLHIDLGSIGGGSFGTVPVVTLNTGKFTDEIVRFGLNYRLAGGP